MRFGGLVAVDDLSFARAARRHHRADRAERRRQDHGVQLHHRLLQADRGPDPAGASGRRARSCSSACSIFRIAKRGARRAHLPEHPAVSRHDRAGEPAGGAAQRADAGLGLHASLGLLGLEPLPPRPSAQAIDKARYWLDRIGLLARADDPAGALPYGEQRRLEIARAMCTDPVLLCLDEPAAGLNARESAELNAAPASDPRRARHLDPADRARHERGDGDFRPRRRARLRHEDRRRHAGGVRNDPKVIAAYLGVDDEELEQVEAEVAPYAPRTAARHAARRQDLLRQHHGAARASTSMSTRARSSP